MSVAGEDALTPQEGMLVWEISSYPMKGCGVGEYARQLVDAFNEAGVHTEHRHLTYRDGLMSSIRDLFKIVFDMRRSKPDLIHIQYTPPTTGPFVLPLCLAAKLRGARMVVTSHERTAPYLKHIHTAVGRSIFRTLDRMISSCGRPTVVHSARHRDELLGSYGLEERNVRVIPIGIERPEAASDEMLDGYRNRTGLSGKTVITFFGIVRPNKGVHVLIEAFAPLARRNDDYHLLIAGAVGRDDLGYGEQLRDQVRDLGLDDRVSFLGFVPDDDIPALMGMSDLVVLPYLESTQSAVLLWQGVAFRRPLIVSDVGGLKEFVEGREVGLTFPVGRHEVLSERMEHLLSDKKLQSRMVEEMEKVLDEMSWPALMPEYGKIFCSEL